MNIILAIHNVNRWVVLILLVITLFQAYRGWIRKVDWEPGSRRAALFTTISMDVQLLLGFVLYFTSPITTQALRDFGAAMGNDMQRFFALEHLLYSILAIAVAHIGSSRAKKSAEGPASYRTLAIFFSLSLLFLFLGIPWFRPLLPGLG